MGRIGQGVEKRPNSIRFTFLEGKPTLRINGEPAAPTPANYKWACRLAAEIRQKIEHGTFSMAEYFPHEGTAGEAVTVSKQLDTWLASQRIEKSTRNGYLSIITFWKNLIGSKAIRALKHSDILVALATRPDLSGKTVNNRVSVLREALEMAVLDKLVTANAVAHVPSAKWQRQPVDPFTAEEANRIIEAMEGTPQVFNYTAFKFYTGVRTGESFGLRWRDVDLAGKSMTIHETIVAGEEKDSTKTNRSREVRLNSRALAALKAQKKFTFMAGEHVFHDPRDDARWTGEPKYRWYWVPTLKRLGMRHRRPYNTRHTYATMMLMAGMTPAFCAAQLGHSRDVFDRSYAKWIPGTGDATEMAKLEAALKNSSPELPQDSIKSR